MATTVTFNSLQDDLRRYLERGFTDASDPEVYRQLPRLINNAERAIATALKVQGFITVLNDVLQPPNNVYAKPVRWREWISICIGTATPLLSTTSRQAVAGTRTLILEKPHPYGVGDGLIITNVGGSGYNSGTPPVAKTLTAVTQRGITYVSGATTEALTPDTGGLVSAAMEKKKFLLTRSLEYLQTYWPDPSVLGEPGYYADYDYYHFILAPSPLRPYPMQLTYYQLPPLLDDSNQTNWLTDIAPNLLLYRALLEAEPFLKDDPRVATWQGLYAEQGQALTGQDMDKIMDRTSERTKP